jgi:gas vesicle protein
MTGSFDTSSSGNDRSIGGSDREKSENETEVLAADIRITQERLGNTVEEIGERFNPTRLKAELKHDIRDATIGRVEDMAQQTAEIVSDAQRTIMQSVRENPIPAAMIGVGLGWLVLNARSSNKKMSSGSLYEEPQQREFGTSYEEEQQSGTLGRARAKSGGVVDSVKEKTSELAEQTQRTASRVGQRAHDMADRVADQTRTQTRRVEQAFQENPLVIGAAALALGLAAGLAIPSTEKEIELVGDAGDHLVDKVRDVAEDTKAKVQQVAERVVNEAQSTAKDAAQEVGLMSS